MEDKGQSITLLRVFWISHVGFNLYRYIKLYKKGGGCAEKPLR